MRRFRKIQKTTLTLLLVLEFFITSAFPAAAGLFGGGGVSIPSASSMASDLEHRYHLDLGNLQSQGETFNVGGNKQLTPQVSLFFTPSDPKEGEKISAKAFPTYFGNPENFLYYTWFLKHVGCDLTNSPNGATRALCDRDDDGRITVEDWKIEAMRLLTQNGYDNTATDYTSSSDDDGYKAKFGGDNKANVPNYCYVSDVSSGVTYELADVSDTSFTCPDGTSPVCMAGQGTVATGTSDSDGGNSYFDVTDSESCYVSGLPACSSDTPICSVGSPRCVADPTTTTSCGSALAACSTTGASSAHPYCKHLFPHASDTLQSGDGSFGASEERFWGTDPQDPDTADNGNKDEANVVGLGQSTLTWNYVNGDQVGVAIEGTSMLPTKHNDASSMIMWAISNNNCPIDLNDGLGSYTETIKGYLVNIPTADFNLNKCIAWLERKDGQPGKEHVQGLVDPTQGGQATRLDVSVTASPSNLVNDPGNDKSGDTVAAQATVANAAQGLADVLFEWTVQISNNIGFSNAGANRTVDVTNYLRANGLLGGITGNALDSIKVKLDIPDAKIQDLLGSDADTGYVRFRVTATENFSNGVMRKGKSDVIVKFVSTNQIITAKKVDANLADGTMKVSLSGTNICNTDPLERSVCRVIKNEIVGLKVDDPNLSNFNWTINGVPLVCTARVSSDCGVGAVDAVAQSRINYFPVTGDSGDTYTVTVTANNIVSGKTVTLTRAFNIVDPKVLIKSVDGTAWPKFLGQYKDISGSVNPVTGLPTCPNGLCDDLSESIFQANSGSTLGFQATFIPGFLGLLATKEWSVDGAEVTEGAGGAMSFLADKPAPGVYAIQLLAQVVQPDSIRRALLDIWGITVFESPEINFSVSKQVEVVEPLLTEGPLIGPRTYYAAIASYIPASVLFTFRIFLSAALTLFALSFLHALLEERRVKAFVESFSRRQ
ncbi:MAG: hypothetical protein WAV46_01870 [Candidatus Moraniibacteriota bacterium]